MNQAIESPRDDTSVLDVIHVVLLLQATLALTAGLAMLLFMGGSPLVWPLTLGTPLLLFVAAAGVVRRWRWARKVAVVVQFSLLLGFALSMLIGMLNVVDFSVNLLTLISNLILPVWLIRELRRPEVLAAFASRPRPLLLQEAAPVAA